MPLRFIISFLNGDVRELDQRVRLWIMNELNGILRLFGKESHLLTKAIRKMKELPNVFNHNSFISTSLELKISQLILAGSTYHGHIKVSEALG